MKFGNYEAGDGVDKGLPSPMAIFTRGVLASGKQWKFKFGNGYGASIINNGHGGDQGLYELAVLDANGNLTYTTPITADVLGYLSPDEVGEALAKIEALPTVGA